MHLLSTYTPLNLHDLQFNQDTNILYMKYIEEKTNTSSIDDFKLDALTTFWQFDQATLNKLETFIEERFKYPKGGGWDLDSLREDILCQNNLMEIEKTAILLPDELSTAKGINLKKPDALQLISQELLQRYKPNLFDKADHQIIQEICQVIYAMEAVRLGIFKENIPALATPSSVIGLMEEGL